MIERYSLPEMKKIWNVHSKYMYWLKVELAVCEAYKEIGEITEAHFKKITSCSMIDPDRIFAIEEEVKHDLIAFLTCVNENLGDEARFMHMGLTSSDVIDTALALQVREANLILFDDLTRLLGLLRENALKYKNTIMIGRSHGIHAEPTTLGIKYALWYDMIKRCYSRLSKAAEEIYIGKIAGAVGTYANIDPRIEEITCKLLDLNPAKTCTQIIQRDIHANYIQTLSLMGSCIELIATEIRSLQRTEILEVEEYFDVNQKGSSAMPHKKNPISSENLCGLARILRSHSVAALENVTLWNERDISHSSAERIIFPDSTILLDYMLNRLYRTLNKLVVYPDNMIKNMNNLGGIIFSQQVLLKLVENGYSREKAYKIVQTHAHNVWNTPSGDFKATLKADKKITNVLTDEVLESCFDATYHLRNIDYIYNKLEII